MRVKHRAKQMQFQEFYGNMYDVNNGIDMLCDMLCVLALFKVFLLYGTFYRASDAPDSVSEIQKGTVARDDPRHVPTNTDEYRAETLKNFFFFTSSQGSLTIQPAQQ